MKILLKNATIIDENSPYHLKEADILIADGVIQKINSGLSASGDTRELILKNLHVSPGWIDSSVSFGEPGYEDRETILNGLRTAALSGFTQVAVNANTSPIADTKGIINFIKSKAFGNAVDLLPVAALTIGSKGIDLAELYDMKSEGAISFYDYKKPIENANLLKIALQYSEAFDGLVQSFPFEKSVAAKGFVNEGENSTKLGLKGIPGFSEELQIARDLKILSYTGGKLHIPTISTRESVQLIREAKHNGLNVTCSVAIFNLMLTDDVLETFDTNYKLLPPLRLQEDINALLDGLADGTIDGVTSDHNPIDVEHKKVEFDQAFYGSIGLESCFGALNKMVGTEKAVKYLTGLSAVFGQEKMVIKEGSRANLSLFDPDLFWKLTEKDLYSFSKNAALLNKDLKGRAYGIISNNQIVLTE
ncbi:MAG TPA: dihydroorotase [Flavobacteriaceae bacterium]|nr:dihydroorotase [Flavobacteriaceae bacterium]